MADVDYEAIIALSEDPAVTLEGGGGEPPGPEDFERVAQVADAIFCRSPLETQIRVIRGWPLNVSVRRLALVSDRQREKILSHLPPDLAEEITSLLPVAAV